MFSIALRIAPIMSMSLTFSKARCPSSTCFQHTDVSSSSISFLAAFVCFICTVAFKGGGHGGRILGGCNKLYPVFLSIHERAAWSVTILLWMRKGSPRMIGIQRPGAIRACTVLEVQAFSTEVTDRNTLGNTDSRRKEYDCVVVTRDERAKGREVKSWSS